MVLRKIPKDDFIIQIIKNVVIKRKVIESQEELRTHVLKQLKKYDPIFVLSPKRVKKLALMVPEIKIKANTRKSPKIKKLKRCPICDKRIKKIYGKNLLGKKIHIGYVCKNCAFQSDLEKFMPMKYFFVWKK